MPLAGKLRPQSRSGRLRSARACSSHSHWALLLLEANWMRWPDHFRAVRVLPSFCLRTGNRTCFLQLFELAHMFDATQHLGLGWGWVGCNNIFELEHMSMLRNIWACTHVRCYATSGLAHMFDATQHLGLHTCSMLRNIWACTHVRCYATSGLAHMFDATQHLGLHTWLLLRNTMGWGGVGGGGGWG